MKHQALFSSKEKSLKKKLSSAAILLASLRANKIHVVWIFVTVIPYLFMYSV